MGGAFQYFKVNLVFTNSFFLVLLQGKRTARRDNEVFVAVLDKKRRGCRGDVGFWVGRFYFYPARRLKAAEEKFFHAAALAGCILTPISFCCSLMVKSLPARTSPLLR